MTFDELKSKFEALSDRERWLVIITAAVVLFLLMDLIFISPLEKTLKQQRSQLANIAIDQEKVEIDIGAWEAVRQGRSNDAREVEKRALEKQISLLQQQMGELTGKLIKAEALPIVLEDILVQTGNLELLELASSPPKPQNNGLIKHGVAIKLTGSYFDVLNYLQALEESQWNFYWQAVDYVVNQYPNAEVEIQVYTFSSTQEGLL